MRMASDKADAFASASLGDTRRLISEADTCRLILAAGACVRIEIFSRLPGRNEREAAVAASVSVMSSTGETERACTGLTRESPC